MYIFLQAVLPHHTHNSVNHEAYSFTLRCFFILPPFMCCLL